MVLLFKAYTTHAHAFRGLADVLIHAIDAVCLSISAESLSVRMMDARESLLIDIVLPAANFNIFYISKHLRDVHPFNALRNGDADLIVGVRLVNLRNAMTQSKKHDSLTMLIDSARPTVLVMNITPRENNRVCSIDVPLDQIQALDISLPCAYTHMVMLASSEFQKTCKEMRSMSAHATITCNMHDGQVVLESVPASSSGRTTIYSGVMATGNDADVKTVFVHRYATDSLVRLARLASLTPAVSMQLSPCEPLCIVVPVGNLGRMQLFVAPIDTHDTDV